MCRRRPFSTYFASRGRKTKHSESIVDRMGPHCLSWNPGRGGVRYWTVSVTFLPLTFRRIFRGEPFSHFIAIRAMPAWFVRYRLCQKTSENRALDAVRERLVSVAYAAKDVWMDAQALVGRFDAATEFAAQSESATAMALAAVGDGPAASGVVFSANEAGAGGYDCEDGDSAVRSANAVPARIPGGEVSTSRSRSPRRMVPSIPAESLCCCWHCRRCGHCGRRLCNICEPHPVAGHPTPGDNWLLVPPRGGFSLPPERGFELSGVSS